MGPILRCAEFLQFLIEDQRLLWRLLSTSLEKSEDKEILSLGNLTSIQDRTRHKWLLENSSSPSRWYISNLRRLILPTQCWRKDRRLKDGWEVLEVSRHLIQWSIPVSIRGGYYCPCVPKCPSKNQHLCFQGDLLFTVSNVEELIKWLWLIFVYQKSSSPSSELLSV